MERAAVNRKEILLEANKLVSNGLRKAAIDLLLEYLEIDPNSSTILSTLGRAYLLDHQPEKAVIYLKRSLEIRQGIDTNTKPTSEYQTDSFSDDDMAYVDSLANTSTEAEYQLEADTPDSKVSNKEKILYSETIPTESPLGEKARIFHEKTDNGTAPGRGNQLSLPPQKASSQSNHRTIESIGDIPSRLDPTQHDVKPAVNDQPGTINLNLGISKEQPPVINRTNPEYHKAREDTQIIEDEEELALSNHYNLPWEDIEEPDLVANRDLFADEPPLEDIEGEDQDEQFSDDLHSLIHTSSTDEESAGLNWDDYEDLDEFDELANRAAEENIQGEEKVSREERARQIAVLVLNESEWDTKHLPLLQKVFFENGWSAARITIQKEIAKGLLPDELALARKIKRLWSENDQYWITFHKIKSNQHSKQADAAYKQMSWLEALRIIRSFPSLPEIEEIYAFVDEAYDHWYNSDRLRRAFKAFYKYLRYRTGLMRRTLPGDCNYTFRDHIDADIGVDSEILLNSLTPAQKGLEQLGILPHPWPRPPENKMKINGEFLNPEKPKAIPEPGKNSTTPISKQQSSGNKSGPSFGFGSSIALAAKGSD